MQEITGGQHWRYPVTIRIGYGLPEAIRGPLEAIECLEHRWPQNAGLYFELALRRCETAARRASSNEEAREMFMSAAIEAYVLA
ncbi:DUF982 domain-containing protein (plasmid) [Neorhizobium sp. SOG26]|uniref:DUF982 domain-containing protein n=1 Tax=Neorhizobium turbinariae TaxID=2937795 RepID=A0ABT0IX44_9HYPH|nr:MULTISPECIES: DUF982 domain-containing protein [Neorhizobium]AXV17845.1 DUF982 domain-containing protein [Neorhizobium sp. SOG26]MCK8782311.1 DUF982 domain-containing protein [Neorhizobium turbinariae]